MKRIVAAGAAVVLSPLMGFGGLAAPADGGARGLAISNKEGKAPNVAVPDEGQRRAVEYCRQKEHRAVVVQYGEKPAPVGPMTGDPEKDTYAYPVKRTDTVWTVARP
jgi:hypothetical protein